MTVSRSSRTGLRAAIGAAAAVGLLSTGVALAASGHAPWSASPAAAGASTHAVDPTHPAHPARPSHSTDPSDDPSEKPGDDSGSAGPNAHAFGGLCRAYMSGNKADHGKALQSRAFMALVTAAGGVDNVTAYCGTVSHGPSGHPTHPSKPSQAASPTHPAKPTHPDEPSEAASPTLPAHPSRPAGTPTHPANARPGIS